MCGILAIYCSNKEKNINEIMKSHQMLSNRGPDCSSLIINKNEIMSFNRLSIVDESIQGNQPFISEKGNKLLCNGEIFNHKKLEEKYNIECKSDSDCECILHLYEKIGFEETINELSGDFAIIVINKNKIYFARDRIGVRPLFSGTTKSGNIALASYARALTNYCENVEQIEPGWGYFNCENKMKYFRKYYSSDYINYEDNLLNINRTLTNSVKLRLMSDRPIGCLLSGGLDSSIIASILCKLIGPTNVKTYSIGMEGSKDLKFAKKVSNFLGTNHQEVLFTPEEGFECIPEVIKDLESYDITTIRASVGMWLLSKWISENTEDIVLFSGEGSDELFCGYLYFHYSPSAYESYIESLRLVKNLYLYDVLRADRCVSSHGLELRVPFLDKNMISMVFNIDSELKVPKNNIEKYILRKAFEKNYLPEEILWRRKDGFSDGVSGDKGKKWFEQIQDFVNEKISEKEFDDYKHDFPNKEAYYYKKIYNEKFPNYQPKYDYWLPKWVNHNGDPSGRNLSIFCED
jgi:asparagine synthase (glutamine-hydrolysing)